MDVCIRGVKRSYDKYYDSLLIVETDENSPSTPFTMQGWFWVESTQSFSVAFSCWITSKKTLNCVRKFSFLPSDRNIYLCENYWSISLAHFFIRKVLSIKGCCVELKTFFICNLIVDSKHADQKKIALNFKVCSKKTWN